MAIIEFRADKPTEEDFKNPDVATWLPVKVKQPEIMPAAEIYRNADYAKILAVLGNGDADRGYFLLMAIFRGLIHARTKHPVFAKNAYQGHTVIFEELDELAYAIANESESRQLDEVIDVIVTGIRQYNEEWE